VLWQAQARRETILDWNRRGALAEFDGLHFATHAVIEQDAPHTSRILLGDGDLTVLDILDLNLNAGLVTLSACSSHLGAGGSGDEWVGLARAFYYAGARALVASLWQVEDAYTTELMTKMYGNLSRGDSISAALQRAQAEMLHAGLTPYHWAAFMASGAV
jgi:CHAT domain-containing protein